MYFFLLRRHYYSKIVFQANDLSFDLSAGGLMSGGLYANPTAQSTPVGASKRGAAAAAATAAAAHSMLTTPNNSLLSLNELPGGGGGNSSRDQQSTPTKSAKYSPARHYSSRLSDAPRTPTPFKKALADVFNRGEPISNTVIMKFTHVLLWAILINPSLFCACSLKPQQN